MISSVVLCAMVLTVTAEEPLCSKYDFLEKILEKLVRMEYKMERMNIDDLERAENVPKTKDDVSSALESLDQRVAEFRSKLEEKSAALEHRMTDTVGRMLKRVENIAESAATPTIAFKARITSDMSVSNGAYIVFPTAMLNEGNAYDNTSGIFIAPVNGTYMFNVIFCVYKDKRLYIDIMVDDTTTAPVVFRGVPNSGCHSAATVEVLTVGQRVGIKGLSGDSNLVINHNPYRWNTFSGTLIHIS